MNSLSKKLLLFLLVMASVAAVGWYGRKAYKQFAERRLVTQASQFLQKKDFSNAALCLQRALQVNPSSATASQQMGDLLEAAGSPAALSWRIRCAQLETNDSNYRFAWAKTALKMHDPASTALALSGIDKKARSSTAYFKLQGALDWENNDRVGAEQNYLAALRNEPANQTLILNVATVRLASTNEVVANEARATLERIPSNSVLHITSYRRLMEDAAAHKDLDKALKYSKVVLKDPAVEFDDQIAYLTLLRESKSPEYASWLARLQVDGINSPNKAYALGHWMTEVTGPTNALHWLHSLPIATQTNSPVPLVIADCQIANKDWQGLLGVVAKQDWADANSCRLALAGLARRSLGLDAASQDDWRKALKECSHRLDRLSRLAQLTGAWGWKPERTQVLKEILTDFPKEKWAGDQLIAELYASGNTVALGETLSKICEVDPSDLRLKNCLASVFLLRKIDLEKAHRLAKEAYDSSTDNPFFTSTYAYSLLVQNRQDEALKIVSTIKPEYLEIPSIAAYYGVIQAQSGHKDIAKMPLARAENARLLPEEKEIVNLARAKL